MFSSVEKGLQREKGRKDCSMKLGIAYLLTKSPLLPQKLRSNFVQCLRMVM